MLPNLGRSPIYVFEIILTQIYEPIIFFQSRPGADPDFLKRGGKQGDPNPTSQFHRTYYFGQEEEEMKLFLMILSVTWYRFNGLEHTAILSHFLTFITGSSSRVSTMHTTF